MTAREIMELERGNLNTVILLKEGIFWKAYEKSAYIFYQQIHPYKLAKKRVQSIDDEMVSLGFPTATTDNIIGERKVLLRDERRLIIESKKIEVEAFEEWKKQVPLTIPVMKEPTAPTWQPQVQPEVSRTYNTIPNTDTSMMRNVVEKIKLFNLESKTPLECMLFLTDLKKHLTEQEGDRG